MSYKAINLVVATMSILIVSTFAGCSSQEEEKIYPYSFDSAKIEFEVTGNKEGSSTINIIGDKFVRETLVTSKDGDTEKNMDTLEIYLEGELYQIDLKTKVGIASRNPIYEQLTQLPKEKRIDFLTDLAVGLSEPIGTNEFAGQTCDTYKGEAFGEMCIWNGIPLYSSIKSEDGKINNTITAVSVQINVDVPSTVFEIPSDITMGS